MIRVLSNLIIAALLASSIGCSKLHQAPPSALADADRAIQEGIWAYSESDWRRARRLFERALAVYRGVDDQEGELNSRINLAETALAANDTAACANQLVRSVEIAQHPSWQTLQPRIDLLYAQLALRQQNISEAKKRLAALLPEDGGMKSTAVQLAALAERTRIAFTQKQDFSFWLGRFERALEITHDTNPELSARLLRFQAYQAQNQVDFEDAGLKLQQALILYKAKLSRPGIAATLVDLADLHKARGNLRLARNFFERALAVYETLGDRVKMVEIQREWDDGIEPMIRD